VLLRGHPTASRGDPAKGGVGAGWVIVIKYNDEWAFGRMCQSRVEGVIIHHLGGTRVAAGCVIVVGEYANA
jgi:hypothetical protein